LATSVVSAGGAASPASARDPALVPRFHSAALRSWVECSSHSTE
jgi:hypothetical protein